MKTEFQFKDKYDTNDLVEIMAILRAPGGCPWDAEQTHRSIRPNLIEETYEAVDAIDNGDDENLKEELGDILLQVVFHARMAEDEGVFDFGDVADGICKKLIRRHPHVFADVEVNSADEVLKNWQEIKNAEKNLKKAIISIKSLPLYLPSTIKSGKIQAQASKKGFDFPNVHSAMEKVAEETAELLGSIEGGSFDEMQDELGDLMFAVINVARLLKVDPDMALSLSCNKFVRRLSAVEVMAEQDGILLEESSPEVLDGLWEKAKQLSF